mgnify:FL=1
MRYQYNYSFLEKWMNENGKISVNTILQAIGSTSNNSLRLWAKGKSPMPVTSIMRFCNTFQVPISAFFFDKDSEDVSTAPFVVPEATDQFEPDGGYVTTRQQGSRGLFNPLNVTCIPSKVPGLVTPASQETETTTEPDDVHTTKATEIDNTSIQALLDLEAKHSLQRDKLLDIINKQQEQIYALTQQIIAINTTQKYQIQQHGYRDIAAEPETKL